MNYYKAVLTDVISAGIPGEMEKGTETQGTEQAAQERVTNPKE